MRNDEIEHYEWGETLNGIIDALQKFENYESNKFDFFDPFLNESINDLEKFVSEYIPRENINIEIKDKELLDKIEKIKFNYVKIGLFISKMFLINLFTEKEMKDFQKFIKKLYAYRNELYEFASFCDLQNPESETNKIVKEHENSKLLSSIEEIKRRYLLIGFLLCKPSLVKKQII